MRYNIICLEGINGDKSQIRFVKKAVNKSPEKIVETTPFDEDTLYCKDGDEIVAVESIKLKNGKVLPCSL